jgi:hypothetical protein
LSLSRYANFLIFFESSSRTFPLVLALYESASRTKPVVHLCTTTACYKDTEDSDRVHEGHKLQYRCVAFGFVTRKIIACYSLRSSSYSYCKNKWIDLSDDIQAISVIRNDGEKSVVSSGKAHRGDRQTVCNILELDFVAPSRSVMGMQKNKTPRMKVFKMILNATPKCHCKYV